MSGSLRKEKIQGYKVKHTLYSIDDDKKLWVDLTLMNKAKQYDSVPIYRLGFNGEMIFDSWRSKKWLQENI